MFVFVFVFVLVTMRMCVALVVALAMVAVDFAGRKIFCQPGKNRLVIIEAQLGRRHAAEPE